MRGAAGVYLLTTSLLLVRLLLLFRLLRHDLVPQLKLLPIQPNNLISVKPYDDPEDREDRTLERITPLLVELSREGHSDIPAALRKFQS